MQYRVYTVVRDVAIFAEEADALEFAKRKTKQDRNFNYHVSKVEQQYKLIASFYKGKQA